MKKIIPALFIYYNSLGILEAKYYKIYQRRNSKLLTKLLRDSLTPMRLKKNQNGECIDMMLSK
jgi:hypothetical protein